MAILWGRMPATSGAPSVPPMDFVTGFLEGDRARGRGRPVGVAVDSAGSLIVADDVGNTAWRVSATTSPP
jgi:glucose/arabinose dehydrogenase